MLDFSFLCKNLSSWKTEVVVNFFQQPIHLLLQRRFLCCLICFFALQGLRIKQILLLDHFLRGQKIFSLNKTLNFRLCLCCNKTLHLRLILNRFISDLHGLKTLLNGFWPNFLLLCFLLVVKHRHGFFGLLFLSFHVHNLFITLF
jgi:hypothetical protein